ncbi:PREDICTED: uncharacterized protein LOC109163986 [Ipomoea nil]|uniref:uncharacterized protein LOC109163986 n=1 Tax=Ipomoea nil TaxID=35883 RepID=UPI000900F5DD|nr:PREDICTED: uncharacterized protein LOC109163986 [Ipomoea nil]
MDPQAFVRVSVGSLCLRVPSESGIQAPSPPCVCEIRLPGFPVQTAPVPFEDNNKIATRFYLVRSDVEALLAPGGGCFYAPNHACLEIVVFSTGGWFGFKRKQHIGTFKLGVGREWGRGKQVVLVNGWIGIGKNNGGAGAGAGAELHLRVKLEPDPRYVFQFEDKVKLSPQIVQIQGSIKQPIFSCEFTRGRSDVETERRERKGWKVTIHDLSGSAVAAAMISTPFVPSAGCDRVGRSNPGTWLIVSPDRCRRQSWQPWGKLEAWRERGGSICFRFHLLVRESREADLLVSEILINADRGGAFYIDIDKAAAPVSASGSGGFVMSCRVQGEGGRFRTPPAFVQVAKRFVTCIEDAAIFMALSAAVDLSIEACKPFPRHRRCSC